VLVNAGPVSLQGIVSTCQSARIALIFARLFCVPPAGTPPGLLLMVLLFPRSVVPGAGEFPNPWKLTVVPDFCAGANMIKTVGSVILFADIAAPLE
jgi:hypothetical protein